MKKLITPEMVEKIVSMYNSGNYTRNEIANLLNISVSTVSLKMRGRRVPGMVYGTGGGYCQSHKKYTSDQEAEIAKDYYENGLTTKEIIDKWGAHPVQLQKIRNLFGAQYGQKAKGKPSHIINRKQRA